MGTSSMSWSFWNRNFRNMFILQLFELGLKKHTPTGIKLTQFVSRFGVELTRMHPKWYPKLMVKFRMLMTFDCQVSSDKVTLVICCIQGILLPSYIGTTISHYKDPVILRVFLPLLSLSGLLALNEGNVYKPWSFFFEWVYPSPIGSMYGTCTHVCY